MVRGALRSLGELERRCLLYGLLVCHQAVCANADSLPLRPYWRRHTPGEHPVEDGTKKHAWRGKPHKPPPRPSAVPGEPSASASSLLVNRPHWVWLLHQQGRDPSGRAFFLEKTTRLVVFSREKCFAVPGALTLDGNGSG